MREGQQEKKVNGQKLVDKKGNRKGTKLNQIVNQIGGPKKKEKVDDSRGGNE